MGLRFRVTLHTVPVAPVVADDVESAMIEFLAAPDGRSTATIAEHIGLSTRATQHRLAKLEDYSSGLPFWPLVWRTREDSSAPDADGRHQYHCEDDWGLVLWAVTTNATASDAEAAKATARNAPAMSSRALATRPSAARATTSASAASRRLRSWNATTSAWALGSCVGGVSFVRRTSSAAGAPGPRKRPVRPLRESRPGNPSHS